MNDFVTNILSLRKHLREVTSALRVLRSEVKQLDAEQFNESPPDLVETFYRNCERADTLRAVIRLATTTIRHLEKLPEEPDEEQEEAEAEEELGREEQAEEEQ